MSTETRNAVIASLASLHAGVDADERDARHATPGPWHIPEHDPLAYCVDSPDGSGRICRFGDRSVGDDVLNSLHIVRHDPARALREVTAIRSLIAEIVAEPHAYIPGDEFYSCSQAVDPYENDPAEKVPGSGCSDPDRAGQPCDCGRDARVERLLSILAGIYDETGSDQS